TSNGGCKNNSAIFNAWHLSLPTSRSAARPLHKRAAIRIRQNVRKASAEMPAQDIIVIGGSAGGLEALATVVGGLPPRMNATVLAVLHTSPESFGALPQIQQRTAALPVSFGIDGEAF